MSDIRELADAIKSKVDDLVQEALNADSGLPDYGRIWGEWIEWDGSSEHGPMEITNDLVNVYRRSPIAENFLVNVAYKLDWLQTGGPEDILYYRVEITEDEE